MKLLSLLLCLCAATVTQATQLTVDAASSLTDAMKEIAAKYEQKSGDQVRLNFDASSILVRQIEEGAPGDIFLSADEAKMDELAKKGLLAPATRRTLLSNSLVIIVPSDSHLEIHQPTDLVTNPAVNKIAISQPNTVPVGIYSKLYLTHLGLWQKIQRKLVPTQNVRASLAAVESGNVEAGLVYKTDAQISHTVKVAYEVPVAKGPTISYSVAALAGSTDLAAARRFLAYLSSAPATAIFRKYGFTIASKEPPVTQ